MMTQKQNVENGTEPILYVNICIAIDTMLNFDGDTNTDVKCEKAFTHSRNILLAIVETRGI